MAERLGEALLELGTVDRGLIRGLDRAGRRARKLGETFRRVGRQISLFVTAPIAALGVAVAKFADTQIQAERTLASVLKLSGGAVDQRLAGFKEFASAMQEITIVGDEVTLKNLQVAKSMGLTDEQAKRAAKNAIALSAAFGIGSKASIRYTASLEAGETEMLNRYIPTLKAIKDPILRAAEAQRILEGAFSAAIEAAKAGLGPFRQMRNDLGDLAEEFGAIVLPAITAFSAKVREIISAIRDLEPVQKEWLVGLAAALAAGGPILIGLGVLAAAIGALLTPIGLVIAALVGAAGLLAVLVTVVDISSDLERATDNVVTAMSDEIRQTQQLSIALGKSNIITLDAAKTKLAEAQARLHNIATMITEMQILKTMGVEYQALTKRIEQENQLLSDLVGADFLSEAGKRKVEEIRATIEILSGKLNTLMEIDPSATRQIQSIAANIGLLLAAIEDTVDGMVPFGDVIITPIEATERLGEAAASTALMLADETERLNDLAEANDEAAEAEREHERQMDSLADSFANAVLEVRDMESALAAFSAILQRFLTQQASSGLSSLFSQGLSAAASLFAGGGGGGAGFAGNTGTGFQPGSFGGFAHGGGFTVGGRGGTDRNLVAFNASRGERVTINKPGASSGVEVNIFAPPGSTVDEERNTIGDTEQINIMIDKATARNLSRLGTQSSRAMRSTFGQKQTLIQR